MYQPHPNQREKDRQLSSRQIRLCSQLCPPEDKYHNQPDLASDLWRHMNKPDAQSNDHHFLCSAKAQIVYYTKIIGRSNNPEMNRVFERQPNKARPEAPRKSEVFVSFENRPDFPIIICPKSDGINNPGRSPICGHVHGRVCRICGPLGTNDFSIVQMVNSVGRMLIPI